MNMSPVSNWALATQQAPLKTICAWCSRVMREGTLPASHGMCPACSAKMHAELDAKEPR